MYAKGMILVYRPDVANNPNYYSGKLMHVVCTGEMVSVVERVYYPEMPHSMGGSDNVLVSYPLVQTCDENGKIDRRKADSRPRPLGSLAKFWVPK